MAFPTGYTKYQEVTIDNTKVTADQTDFIVYVDMSDMDVATDIFDTCRTDGGDIRVTKSDGTTELAREVVVIDTTAKTGELHIKYAGTLSSSTDTVIRIYYNGTDTEPASTATYGSEAVWTGYWAVYHMEEDPSGTAPQMTDSSGNGNAGTSQGSMVTGDKVAGQLAGSATEFNTTTQWIDIPYTDWNTTDTFTVSTWFYTADASLTPRLFSYGDKDGAGNKYWATGNVDSGLAHYSRFPSTSSHHLNFGASTGFPVSAGWYHYALAVAPSDRRVYAETLETSDTGDYTIDQVVSADRAAIAGAWYNNLWNGPGAEKIDEMRLAKTALASTWVSTEYNNQDSASTFYSVGTEQGGGSSTSIKSINGLAQADIKSWNGVALE